MTEVVEEFAPTVAPPKRMRLQVAHRTASNTNSQGAAMNIHRLELWELAQGYRDGSFTPVDVVDVYLERIDRFDATLNAYVSVYADEARLAARQLTAELSEGRVRGRLHGIPVALKDLIELEGLVTTAGSAACLDHHSTITATLAKRLLRRTHRTRRSRHG